MNPYYYLFYKIYTFTKRINKQKEKGIEWNAMYAHSLFIGWNFGLIFIITLPVTKENFNTLYKMGLIIFLITFFIFNYIIFLHKNRYKKILKLYENESLKSKRIGSFLVILYIGISFFSIFFV